MPKRKGLQTSRPVRIMFLLMGLLTTLFATLLLASNLVRQLLTSVRVLQDQQHSVYRFRPGNLPQPTAWLDQRRRFIHLPRSGRQTTWLHPSSEYRRWDRVSNFFFQTVCLSELLTCLLAWNVPLHCRDWELFNKLGATVGAVSKADDLITQLVMNVTSRTPDAVLLEKVRRQAAHRIMAPRSEFTSE